MEESKRSRVRGWNLVNCVLIGGDFEGVYDLYYVASRLGPPLTPHDVLRGPLFLASENSGQASRRSPMRARGFRCGGRPIQDRRRKPRSRGGPGRNRAGPDPAVSVSRFGSVHGAAAPLNDTSCGMRPAQPWLWCTSARFGKHEGLSFAHSIRCAQVYPRVGVFSVRDQSV